MADIVSPEVRSQMMSGIRGKNTKPEIVVRKGLHERGFRYRLYVRDLRGKPDLVFPKYRAVIFVHGCFWHCHQCHMFKWPKTRREFWRTKITRNLETDRLAMEQLRSEGWRIMTIWECALKGKNRLPIQYLLDTTSDWLRSNSDEATISGQNIDQQAQNL